MSFAGASAPQRWTLSRPRGDGWSEVVHQLLGDGVFAGDSHRTTIVAGEGSRLVVRGIAPTALRGSEPSSVATRLIVRRGARVLYLPGPLVPHAGSTHTNALRVEVADGGGILFATTTTPGRIAMGEHGAFERLSLRTVVHVAGKLCLGEDASLSGAEVSGTGSFDSASAYVSVVAAGAIDAAEARWWDQFVDAPSQIAVSKLRTGGMAARALFHSLGEAQSFLAEVELAVRSGPVAPNIPLACEQV